MDEKLEVLLESRNSIFLCCYASVIKDEKKNYPARPHKSKTEKW